VRRPRRASTLAQGQGDGAPSSRRLRPVHARPRRFALSRRGVHPRRAGNLSTHTAAALYQAFPPAEARRILRRLEFHYTPKHASWLNMVEIELAVLRSQCLDRRITTQEQLKSEIATWEHQRNASGARIKWMFTTDKARAKMGRAYPQPILGRQT